MLGSSDGPYPMPFPGETFLLTRDKLELGFEDANRKVGGIRGRLFITNLRMVFRVAESNIGKAQCESFEMPFRGLWDERLNQPIFGTNNLTATMMYYDEQPFAGVLSIKLVFKEGGVGTFLNVFNNVLRATRIQLNRERANAAAGANATADVAAQPPPIPAEATQPEASAPPSSQFLPVHSEAAFVDPHDPSRIYTTQQPTLDSEQRRDTAPEWSVSGQGVRKRR